MPRKLTRRTFLEQLGSVTAATLGASVVGIPSTVGSPVTTADAEEMGSNDLSDRRWQAYRLRHDAAMSHSSLPFPSFPTNGDEDRYPNKIASYTKGLPHNQLGEVDVTAYTTLVKALETGQPAAFHTLPLGGRVKFANPLAAHAFELEGYDPHQLAMVAPPAFSSAETASEMIELYWQALTRDVPFAEYDTHPLTNAAAADLSQCSVFRGPKAGGYNGSDESCHSELKRSGSEESYHSSERERDSSAGVYPEQRRRSLRMTEQQKCGQFTASAVASTTLFRGNTPGDLVGPYLSQFLWLDVPQGVMTLTQRGRVPVAGDDYVTTYPEWLSIQRGFPPARVNGIDPTPRYLRNGRDLAAYVHRDFTYQAYLHACLILLTMRAPLKVDNPYRRSLTQEGFITFGAPHVLDLVARVANAALKAAWCHKWLVHRRLRPETFAGRVHNHVTGAAQYSIHTDALNAAVLSAVFHAFGSYLLPMAYPEGCPTHPAYPAGHAAIAGACATVLKAFFNEAFVLPNPVLASPDGLSLLPYKGADLTVGGELNKLASNIALGRNTAGVHWRSDSIEGLKLGEAVAIGILTDLRMTCPEPFIGFSFTKFEGSTITI